MSQPIVTWWLGGDQGCSLGLDVSVSRRSRDVPYVSSRLGGIFQYLGLVSVSRLNVSGLVSVSAMKVSSASLSNCLTSWLLKRAQLLLHHMRHLQLLMLTNNTHCSLLIVTSQEDSIFKRQTFPCTETTGTQTVYGPCEFGC